MDYNRELLIKGIDILTEYVFILNQNDKPADTFSAHLDQGKSREPFMYSISGDKLSFRVKKAHGWVSIEPRFVSIKNRLEYRIEDHPSPDNVLFRYDSKRKLYVPEKK